MMDRRELIKMGAIVTAGAAIGFGGYKIGSKFFDGIERHVSLEKIAADPERYENEKFSTFGFFAYNDDRQTFGSESKRGREVLDCKTDNCRGFRLGMSYVDPFQPYMDGVLYDLPRGIRNGDVVQLTDATVRKTTIDDALDARILHGFRARRLDEDVTR